jgi:hypothetical protein
MPLTATNTTGDGVTADFINTSITLPDSGTALPIVGRVQAKGAASTVITGSPLAMPAALGSGSVYWNVQVDVTTGAATVQQSTVSDPAAINGNNRVVFRQTLVPASTDPALVGDATPDTW